MAVIDDVKILLGISSTDIAKDDILNLYIRKGKTLIISYLNAPVTDPPLDVETSYPDALAEYVVICYRKRGNEGAKNSSQGSRSATYEIGLSDSVKALLPIPSVRMHG